MNSVDDLIILSSYYVFILYRFRIWFCVLLYEIDVILNMEGYFE